MTALLSAARNYIAARLAHVGAARGALLRAMDTTDPSGATGPRYADGEQFAPDGVPLTTEGEFPEGDKMVKRWIWIMPTAVELERVERALKVAVATDGADSELRKAAADQLAEQREPWYGYDPNKPSEVARADARTKRHSAVFQRLQDAVSAAVSS